MNYILSPLMLYFSRHALLYYFLSLFILSFIVCLSELIEYEKLTSHIYNDFSISIYFNYSLIFSLKMTLLKMPFRIQNLLPYAIFFGSIISLLRLSYNSELIIARSSGLNIWYCCLPHIILAFIIGLISITIFSY